MKYSVGDKVIIKNIPIYSDINSNKEYFLNKKGFIVSILKSDLIIKYYFDINISGKIYTFYDSDFVLDILYYRNLKLGTILDEEQI
jgi:hypothetical protein